MVATTQLRLARKHRTKEVQKMEWIGIGFDLDLIWIEIGVFKNFKECARSPCNGNHFSSITFCFTTLFYVYVILTMRVSVIYGEVNYEPKVREMSRNISHKNECNKLFILYLGKCAHAIEH